MDPDPILQTLGSWAEKAPLAAAIVGLAILFKHPLQALLILLLTPKKLSAAQLAARIEMLRILCSRTDQPRNPQKPAKKRIRSGAPHDP